MSVTPKSQGTDPSDNGLQRVPVSLSVKERFEEYLQSRQMRNTSARKILVERVFTQHDHFDADALIDRMPAKGESDYVSRATIYRTLKEFVDAGLLREFQLEGRAVYEFDYGYPQHDHLYCEKCEELFEFQSDELLELRNKLGAEQNFRVKSHRFIIHGICSGCSAKSHRPRRKVDLI